MNFRWFTIFHWQVQMHIRCSISTNLVNLKEITTGTFYLSTSCSNCMLQTVCTSHTTSTYLYMTYYIGYIEVYRLKVYGPQAECIRYFCDNYTVFGLKLSCLR